MLDVSPPKLQLIIILGVLEVDDSRDINVNASYIMINGGMLRVGTATMPFQHKATITLLGGRLTNEIPVYGSKCIGVRNGILDLHGIPVRPWTQLSRTANVNDSWIEVTDSVNAGEGSYNGKRGWQRGDLIAISSTGFDQEEAEPMRIDAVSSNGLRIRLQKPLIHHHAGEGWVSADGQIVVSKYRATVILLSRNVIVQGDYETSRREQFGAQIVLHSRGDNSLIGRLSHVEVRNAGQGLKLGKYPIHFHMVGSVSKSFVRGCAVHHAFNRAITIHGVNELRVQDNVVFDTRGHAVFMEDGTEMKNVIERNVVMVVRPVWSLLTVDQVC